MYELLDALPHSRRAARRPVDMPCEVVCADSDEPLPVHATDLSAYGLWVRTSCPLRRGQRVVLCFRPPRWPRRRELTVFAEVTRVLRPERKPGASHAGGMALAFRDLVRDDRIALHRCLHAAIEGEAAIAGRAASRALAGR